MGGYPPINSKIRRKIALLPFLFKFGEYDFHLLSQSHTEFERWHFNMAYTTDFFRFRMFGWKMASAFRAPRVDFIPADDVLENIFGFENFLEGMYNEEESDIDRQQEN